PVFIDPQLNIVYPVAPFKAALRGHVHMEPGIDGVVRGVYQRISCRSVSLPAFASAMYRVIHARAAAPPAIQTDRIADRTIDTVIQSDPLRINFYGPRGTFNQYSVADILDGRWPPSYFTDKIVLVGTTSAGVDESFWVPFTQSRNGMPGVEIQAHILNNLLDQSAIQPVARWVTWMTMIGWAAFCFYLFVRFENPGGMLIGLLSLVAITVIVYILFAAFNLWLAPASSYFAVAAVFILAYVYNLQRIKKLFFQAKENWEESFNTIDDAITIHHKDGHIDQANRAASQVFGPPLLDYLTQRCIALCRPYQADRIPNNRKIKEGLDTKEVFNPLLGRHLEIKSLPRFDTGGRFKGMVQIVRDISEKKKSELEHKELQTQLITAQKMEAIGTLAGGIAHDFNNILAAVMGHTELSLRDIPESSPLKRRLVNVLNACLRAKELVHQILTFSRQHKIPGPPQPIQVGLIIRETLKLLRSTLPTTIQIHTHIDSSRTVLIAPTQMHQIMMNLCTNAKHAMEENGGILTVALRDAALPPASDSGHRDLDLPSGSYVKLTIKDTGHGMAPDIVNRIFDPYFTTKEKGDGTGLGLATVHGIVKNHGGSILVESAPGSGSAFHVYLPHANAVQLPNRETPAHLLPKGCERILLIDDEDELVIVGRDMLQHLGYQVVTATSGQEALAIFRKKPEQFDMVLTDMTMPDMTGDTLSRELLKIRPDIPVILCTGYSEKIDAVEARQIGIRAFVLKPLTLGQLAQTVREVLDGNRLTDAD
ncbi:MAG: CHASE2 domain-containing protein, partial [Desulfobacterales bacterium]